MENDAHKIDISRAAHELRRIAWGWTTLAIYAIGLVAIASDRNSETYFAVFLAWTIFLVVRFNGRSDRWARATFLAGVCVVITATALSTVDNRSRTIARLRDRFPNYVDHGLLWDRGTWLSLVLLLPLAFVAFKTLRAFNNIAKSATGFTNAEWSLAINMGRPRDGPGLLRRLSIARNPWVLPLGLIAIPLAWFLVIPLNQSIARDAQTGINLLLLGTSVAVVSAGLAFLRPDARKLLLVDPRAPLLLLRSFKDDTLPLSAPIEILTERFYPVARKLEPTLAAELSRIGPLIAIGMPTEPVPRMGASRTYVHQGTWQETISEWLADTRAIVLILGRGEGLQWEIDQVIAGKHLPKLLIVFPPGEAAADKQERRDRWQHFCGQFASEPQQKAMTLIDVTDALLAFIDNDSRWTLVTCTSSDQPAYQLALRLWLARKFKTE